MRWKFRVFDLKIYFCGNWVVDCLVLKILFLLDLKEMFIFFLFLFVKENFDNKNKIFGSVGYYKIRLVVFVYLILIKLWSYV